jgi:hypothetical protein
MVFSFILAPSAAPCFSAQAPAAAKAKAKAKATGSSVVFTLMEQKRATVKDLINVLLIFNNKNIEKMSDDEKITKLRDMKVINGRTKINMSLPLTKGFAALLFHAALEIKGGAVIRLTGRSQRNCLQDLIFYKIMPDSSAKDKMSGPDLVSLLQRAKEYKISLKNGGEAALEESVEKVRETKVEKAK